MDSDRMEGKLIVEYSFYIMKPSGPGDPLLLVPSHQFGQFLKFTNEEIDQKLAIPRGGARENFFLDFGDFGTPVPRFLGRVQGKEAYEGLSNKWHRFPKDDLKGLPTMAVEFFKDTLDKAYSSFKASKKNPEAAKQKRVERQKNFGRVTKRVQKYLGLRVRATHPTQPSKTPLFLLTLRILTIILGYPMGSWNIDKPAPYILDSTVRFVCVDVEAYERDANVITEIGLAVLDSEDIMDMPTGKDGENWFSEIKAFHLRISEYSSLVNSEFVRGCPDSFNFG